MKNLFEVVQGGVIKLGFNFYGCLRQSISVSDCLEFSSSFFFLFLPGTKKKKKKVGERNRFAETGTAAPSGERELAWRCQYLSFRVYLLLNLSKCFYMGN